MWTIEYEQGPSADARFYKFDHEPIADGAWHALRTGAGAQYRITRGVLQFVSPCDETSKLAVDEILHAIGIAAPIPRNDVVEIVVSKLDRGYRVMDPTAIHRPDGIVIPVLTKDALGRAVEELRCDP